MVVQSKMICNSTSANLFCAANAPYVGCYHKSKLSRKTTVIVSTQNPGSAPSTSTPGLYPEIDAFDSGLLRVSPVHQIYFEQCGNPDGVPVLFLHGGPGSGCNAKQRRFFDPDYYRVILFDQRGCGRSLPRGGVEENTTQHLVEDIEALRTYFCIPRWQVFGGSWGSTLALAYATRNKERIIGLILRGIFLARPDELKWFLYQANIFFPEAHERLVAPLNDNERNDILRAYQQRLFSPDPSVCIPAARTWNAYEASIMTLLPNEMPPATPTPDDLLLARAQVQLHYLINNCFLSQQPLLGEIAKLRDLPCQIIQGRYDMVCPPTTAIALRQAWPEAEFTMVEDAGHSAMEPGITAALVAATEKFKSLPR